MWSISDDVSAVPDIYSYYRDAEGYGHVRFAITNSFAEARLVQVSFQLSNGSLITDQQDFESALNPRERALFFFTIWLQRDIKGDSEVDNPSLSVIAKWTSVELAADRHPTSSILIAAVSLDSFPAKKAMCYSFVVEKYHAIRPLPNRFANSVSCVQAVFADCYGDIMR